MNDRDPTRLAVLLAAAIGLLAITPVLLRTAFEGLTDMTDMTDGVRRSADSTGAADTPPPPPAAPDSGLDWTQIGAVAGSLIAAILLLAGVATARAWVKRRRIASQADRDVIAEQWDKAHNVLGEVSDSFAAYNADLADQIFARPLLADTTEPRTAAFIAAYNTAQAAAFDSRPHNRKLADTALATATAARDAWNAAAAHATTVGLGDLQPHQRVSLRRAKLLLEQALDPALSDDNRNVVITKIVDLVASASTVTAPPIRALINQSITRQLSQHAEPTDARRLPASPPAASLHKVPR